MKYTVERVSLPVENVDRSIDVTFLNFKDGSFSVIHGSIKYSYGLQEVFYDSKEKVYWAYANIYEDSEPDKGSIIFTWEI